MILNETPVRTSKNFEINNAEIKDLTLLAEISEFNNVTITGDIENIKISNNTSKRILRYGVSKELEAQIYSKSNQDIKIEIEDSEKKNIYINFDFDEQNINLIDNIEIIAKANTEGTIILKYMSKNNIKYYHSGLLRVTAEDSSNLNIIVINMLNNKSNNMINIENTCDNNSIVNYTIIDFGGKNSITNYYSDLLGEKAVNNLDTIYLGTNEQFFDINYIMELRGEKSKANIEVQGALNDKAKKNFKGTIDFKKGCKKAIGNENEFCMLLSDEARSKALPMLLCTEEDVEGNHSSAAGKVEDKILFYIMSRGISRSEAMKLIVKAKFNNIIDKIKDDELKEIILKEIDRRL